MTFPAEEVRKVIEALLFSSDEPINVPNLVSLLETEFESEDDCAEHVRNALLEIDRNLSGSALELRQLASGVRLQIKEAYSPWVTRLWQRKPPKYSRALLETLALIAYRQPVTRGDIEEIRGVQVRTTTIRTLLERGWIKEVGKRQTPGYPVLYGTTKSFLDYFNLQSLEELPPLSEIDSLTSNEENEDEVVNNNDELLEDAVEEKLEEPGELDHTPPNEQNL